MTDPTREWPFDRLRRENAELRERLKRLRDAAREHLEYCADASVGLFRDALSACEPGEEGKVYVQGLGLVTDRPTLPPREFIRVLEVDVPFYNPRDVDLWMAGRIADALEARAREHEK